MSKDPSRHSPDPKIDGNVSKKAKESTEMDLWDIDLGEEDAPSPPENVERSSGQLPVQRQSVSNISTRKPSDLRPKSSAGAEPAEHKPLADEAHKPRPTSEEQTEPGKHRAKKKPAYKAEKIPAKRTETANREDLEDEAGVEMLEIGQELATREWEETPSDESDSKDLKPVPAIPAIGSLSRVEKIAISALCAVFALGAILTLVHFSNRVPTRPLVAEEIDFPVSGKIIEITAADTYWREPVTTGEDPDVVRRGTQLIPVLKLKITTQAGAIRVFFRDAEGVVMGDGITRSVNGDSEVTVAATAGFEDVGMHTAYRTGDGKRWVVQVFEAPEATSPREKFRKVLETEISTQIQ